MGRDKAREVRAVAEAKGWLDRDQPLPENGELAEVFASPQRPSTPSSVEPFREQVTAWHRRGPEGTMIHRPLRRRYKFSSTPRSRAPWRQ